MSAHGGGQGGQKVVSGSHARFVKHLDTTSCVGQFAKIRVFVRCPGRMEAQRASLRSGFNVDLRPQK
jgi:hypothetical protein